MLFCFSQAKHQKVCEKNAAKKRKVFDSSKQRAPEEAQQIARPRVPKKQPKAKVNILKMVKYFECKEEIKNVFRR